MAFAGLTLDVRTVINRVWMECQSHRLTVEDPVTVVWLHRQSEQHYTQSNGCRLFDISALFVGFGFEGTPRFHQTGLQGTYQAWRANATGWGAKSGREFSEKNYTDKAIDTADLRQMT